MPTPPMELVHFRKRGVVYLLVLIVSLSFCYGDKIDLYLKRLNKTPLKSIKSSDGDIIDCIPISQQPAFDNPSLKHHSIQMSPSYHLQPGSTDEKNVSNNGEIKQTWHLAGMCPQETIPIRRTTREDILRASSIEGFGKKQHRSTVPLQSKSEKPAVNTGHEYAVAYVRKATYYGSKACINLWRPKVQQSDEFSLSQIWVIGGSSNFSDVNTLEAGWQVYQQIYGDYNPRLFIYWTADGYANTGCYNLVCSGFIQTNNTVLLGGTISPTSSYMGTQYSITILIWKDPQGGNWWLKIGDTTVGYWPSKLFPHLGTSADMLEWGGEIVNKEANGQHTTTNMGSGYFPEGGFGNASYFRNIQTVNGQNTLIPVSNLLNIVSYPYCYNMSIGYASNWGNYFFYGGPGQNNKGCP